MLYNIGVGFGRRYELRRVVMKTTREAEKVPTQQEIEQQRESIMVDACHVLAIAEDAVRTKEIERRRRIDAEHESRCGATRRMFDKGLKLADEMEVAFQQAGFKRSYGGDYCNDEVCEWKLGDHNVTLELARSRGSSWSCGHLTGECKLVTRVEHKRQCYGVSDYSVKKVIARIKEIVAAELARIKAVEDAKVSRKSALERVADLFVRHLPDFDRVSEESKLVAGTWFIKQADDCYRDFKGRYKECAGNAHTLVVTILSAAWSTVLRVDTETLECTMKKSAIKPMSVETALIVVAEGVK
jgi:hypothetical protein